MNLAEWLWDLSYPKARVLDNLPHEVRRSEWFERISGNSWDGAWNKDSSLIHWLDINRDRLLEGLFRNFDPSDKVIESLINSDEALRTGVNELQERKRDCIVSFKSIWPQEEEQQDSIMLPDLVLTSVTTMHAFIVLDSAVRPFNFELEPPTIAVSRGSIQLSVSGGLFASGLSLLVACASGLIATPLAIPAGIALGTVGAIDLAQNWKKRSAEIELLRAEELERLANRRKLLAEVEKLEAETKRLRSMYQSVGEETEEDTEEDPRLRRIDDRLKELERQRPTELRSFMQPASKRVEIGRIEAECERLGIPTWMGCHLLNRSIPAFVELSRLSQQYPILIRKDDQS